MNDVSKEELIRRNTSLEKQVKTLKQALEITGEPDEQLQVELDSIRAALSIAQKRNAELETKCKMLESNNKSASTRNIDIEHDDNDNDLSTRESLAEQIALAESRQQKIKSLSKQKVQIQSELETKEADYKKLKTDYDLAFDENTKLNNSVNDLQSELANAIAALEKERHETQSIRQEMEHVRDEHDVFVITHKTLTMDLENKKASIEQLKAKLAAAEKETQDLKDSREESLASSKIAAKRSKQLIKELQTEVAKQKEFTTRKLEEAGVLHQQEIDQWKLKEKAKQDEANALQETMTQLRDELEALKRSTRLGGAFSMMWNAKAANGTGVAGGPPSEVDDEVKHALAKRLESLLNENQALKEKVSFLESNIQSYISELEQVRTSRKNRRGADL